MNMDFARISMKRGTELNFKSTVSGAEFTGRVVALNDISTPNVKNSWEAKIDDNECAQWWPIGFLMARSANLLVDTDKR